MLQFSIIWSENPSILINFVGLPPTVMDFFHFCQIIKGSILHENIFYNFGYQKSTKNSKISPKIAKNMHFRGHPAVRLYFAFFGLNLTKLVIHLL